MTDLTQALREAVVKHVDGCSCETCLDCKAPDCACNHNDPRCRDARLLAIGDAVANWIDGGGFTLQHASGPYVVSNAIRAAGGGE